MENEDVIIEEVSPDSVETVIEEVLPSPAEESPPESLPPDDYLLQQIQEDITGIAKNLDDIYTLLETTNKNQEILIHCMKASNTFFVTLIFVTSITCGLLLARIVWRKF